MTTLFSHPRQPRRDTRDKHDTLDFSTVPRRFSARPTALQRPTSNASFAPPAEPVPSFIPTLVGTDVDDATTASWDAIASTARRLDRAETVEIDRDIVILPLHQRIAIRTFDLVAATVLLTVTLPLMLLIGLLVAVSSRGPIYFVSWRMGRAGNMFACLKFRTMVPDAESELSYLLAANTRLANEHRASHSLRLDPRVTGVGRILRRTHLDELPQLLNVLTGSMSLVGPRPIVPRETALYGPSLSDTLAVKPGITGAWQTSKRLGSYPGRVANDARYVAQRSMFGDLWICIRTVGLVVGIGRRENR